MHEPSASGCGLLFSSAASPPAYRAAPADAPWQIPAAPSRSRRCASRSARASRSICCIDRDGDMADHADVGERRRIAMAEAPGLLVAGEMAFQRGQRLDGPVPPPCGLLGRRADSVRDRDSAAPAAPAADGPRRRPSAPARAPGRGRAASAGSSGGSGCVSSRYSRIASDWNSMVPSSSTSAGSAICGLTRR